MSGILDRYLRVVTWRAASTDDVFALALAKRLGAIDEIEECRRFATRYPHFVLANAAERSQRKSAPGIAAFRSELTEQAFTRTGQPPELIALKVERKSLAAVVLRADSVIRTERRTLTYSNDGAARAAAGLVGRLAEDHPDAAIAFDTTGSPDTRRGSIVIAARTAARQLTRAIYEVPVGELLGAFSLPPSGTREELRDIVRQIFAHIQNIEEPEVADAVAAGVVVYCRRLLWRDSSEAGRP